MTEHPITTLKALREAEAACRRCPLYKKATQVVPGEGLKCARLMLVGEQPGDQEDKQGKPFVGPAGRVLVRALDDAGIERGQVFVTNAVKHFKLDGSINGLFCLSRASFWIGFAIDFGWRELTAS